MNKDNQKVTMLLKNKKYKECILEFENIIHSLIYNYLVKNNINFKKDLSLYELLKILKFNLPEMKGICEYALSVFQNEENSSLEMLNEYVEIYKILKERLT